MGRNMNDADRISSRNPADEVKPMKPSCTRTLSSLALVAATLLAASCDRRNDPAGALPGAARALSAAVSGPACTGSGPHEKHILTFECSTCHPAGGTFGFDKPYTFPGGTTTTGGVIVRSATGTSCTVACHYPKGAPAHEIAWNASAPLACTSCHAVTTLPPAHPTMSANASRSDCEACHTLGTHTQGTVVLVSHGSNWMNTASTEFHAYSANGGLESCKACHGADLAGGRARGCGACHDQTSPTLVSWKVRCTMCHGGTDDQSGAPPRTTWGNTADVVRVGAHKTHLHPSSIAPAFPCAVCHVTPADALSSAHIDGGGIAEVTFGGMAVIGTTPAPFDRANPTCANTYCHGANRIGGTNKTPNWTRVGQGEAACGTCHGVPPGNPHPNVGSSLTGCNPCHPDTMDAAGGIIPVATGGKHLDGAVQAAGGHTASWTDPTSPDFHAKSANSGLDGCKGCHGATLDGGMAQACGNCHNRTLPVGVASWKTNCVMCHGGTDNQTGAPPKATWGNAADAVRTGLHTVHLTSPKLKAPVACATCHVRPTDALTTGHIEDGIAEVKFSGIANQRVGTGTWNRASQSCTNYCHTATYGAPAQSPTWTSTTPADCGTCHGNPPPAPHYTDQFCGQCHDSPLRYCDLCHYPGQTTNPKHINGVVEVPNDWWLAH
jgi:predicted CxxxxCH...CXXCH cytochrome family protein